MVTPAPGAPGGGCWRTPGRSSPPQRRRRQCCAAWLGRPAGCTPAGAGCAQSQQSRAWCGGHSGWSRQQQGAAQTAGAQEAGRGGAAISSQRVALAGQAGARHAPSPPTCPPACLAARGAHLAAAESLGHIQLDGKGDGAAERGHQPQPLVGMGTGLEQPHHHLHSKKEGRERAQQQCWAGAIIDFWRCSRCRCRRRSCRLLAGTDCMDVVGRKLTVGMC